MPWGAAIAAVGSIAAGSMSASAAGDAADAQAESAAKADATQRYMYDTTRADNAQFLGTGQGANNRLAYLLGISGEGSQKAPEWNQIWNKLVLQDKMPFGNPEQVKALTDATAQQYQAQTGRTDGGVMPDTGNPTGDFGSLMRNFSQADMDADPVYQSGLQFGLDEGRKGLNNQAAANGSLNSGAVLKALTRFGNDYGSTKAGDSYNRNKTDKASTFNMLSGVSGTGQVAANQVGAAGQTMANSVSQNQLALGNVRGASAIAQGNAMSNSLTGAYNNYQQGRLIDGYLGKNGSGGGNGGGFSGYGTNSNTWDWNALNQGPQQSYGGSGSYSGYGG